MAGRKVLVIGRKAALLDAALTAMRSPAPFRFDPVNHEYWLGEERVPSITQMLDDCCYIDDRYYTAECADRGTWVHAQCAAYDQGAIEAPQSLELNDWKKDWKGYVLAWVKAMRDIRPAWDSIEAARVHPTLLFGGRPDRTGKIWGAVSVLDIKTGGTYDWHGVQTALQAILVADEYKLPPPSIVRFGMNLTANGIYKLIEHKDRRDFERARDVLRRCAREVRIE